ncbi:hypothetical protein SCACP_25060 [Sporomusa carbonis]|uniref:recombinase family protein n=1 Tax=Sporomusa carbonis TaxID=3076075 RepID=UPI003A5D6E61
MKKVQVIEAKQAFQAKVAEKPKLRVCAYCRVSSSHEEQLNSFDAQVEYYTNYIKSNQDWIFAGIYADDGVSGKSKEKRTRIAKDLERDGVPNWHGKPKWYEGSIRKMLTNEKYKGDALLQKTYTVDFLSKKRADNNGQVPQYYVEDSHPANQHSRMYN